jgi:hypothetical protein
MRMVGMALVMALALGTAARADGTAVVRTTRCCVDLDIPQVPGPVCAQVRGRHGLGPRRACRLLGGTPLGRGDCSLAACRPAGAPGMMGRSS